MSLPNPQDGAGALVGSIYSAAGNIIFLASVTGAHPLAAKRGSRIQWQTCDAPGTASPAEMLCLLISATGSARAMFWNPDGTPEDVCGNALRVIGLALGQGSGEVDVETPSSRVPVYSGQAGLSGCRLGWPRIGRRLAIDGYHGYHVDAGTPHHVFYDVDPSVFTPELNELAAIGTSCSVSTTFCQADGKVIRARTVERGVGETRSCGTGAAAAYAVAYERFPGTRDSSESMAEFTSGERLMVFGSPQSGSVTIAGQCRLIADAVTVWYSAERKERD